MPSCRRWREGNRVSVVKNITTPIFDRFFFVNYGYCLMIFPVMRPCLSILVVLLIVWSSHHTACFCFFLRGFFSMNGPIRCKVIFCMSFIHSFIYLFIVFAHVPSTLNLDWLPLAHSVLKNHQFHLPIHRQQLWHFPFGHRSCISPSLWPHRNLLIWWQIRWSDGCGLYLKPLVHFQQLDQLFTIFFSCSLIACLSSLSTVP